MCENQANFFTDLLYPTKLYAYRKS